jgi:hypothetical protein
MGFEHAFSAMLVSIFPATVALAVIFAFIGGIVWGVAGARRKHRTAKVERPTFERIKTRIYEDDEL